MSNLKDALGAVDWNGHVADFSKDAKILERIEACNAYMAHWAIQFEVICKGNPALTFVRDMQSSGHHVAALLALSMYKPAAAAMRGAFESALYFSYFESHPIELATLVRDKDYYLDKKTVVEHHRLHALNFNENQQLLGLLSRLNAWYSDTSAIVHGQLPGVWVPSASLAEVAPDGKTLGLAVRHFEACVDIINRLFLCCFASRYWCFFEKMSKQVILKGYSAEQRKSLGLDLA